MRNTMAKKNVFVDVGTMAFENTNNKPEWKR
jgi:hypothetical protein